VKPVDFAKAAGIAAAVFVLDLLLAVAVVYVWFVFMVPGHSHTYYQTERVPLALLSTRILGTALIFAACWWSVQRNPQRNALAFALTVVICYGLIDGATAAFKGFFTVGFGITMLLKLVAAIAGAQVAAKLRPRAS
jgi:hypothetical protein